jgi:hypothetical protein
MDGINGSRGGYPSPGHFSSQREDDIDNEPERGAPRFQPLGVLEFEHTACRCAVNGISAVA